MLRSGRNEQGNEAQTNKNIQIKQEPASAPQGRVGRGMAFSSTIWLPLSIAGTRERGLMLSALHSSTDLTFCTLTLLAGSILCWSLPCACGGVMVCVELDISSNQYNQYSVVSNQSTASRTKNWQKRWGCFSLVFAFRGTVTSQSDIQLTFLSLPSTSKQNQHPSSEHHDFERTVRSVCGEECWEVRGAGGGEADGRNGEEQDISIPAVQESRKQENPDQVECSYPGAGTQVFRVGDLLSDYYCYYKFAVGASNGARMDGRVVKLQQVVCCCLLLFELSTRWLGCLGGCGCGGVAVVCVACLRCLCGCSGRSDCALCYIVMQRGDNKAFRAQALPFILINERQEEGGRISYEFELQKQAADVIAAIKNKKIAVATVAGPQRSGKSFLSNRLLKRMSGFAIGPTTMPCTKGLWIWGEPVAVSEDTVLIIMDTEGLNSVQRDINVDLKIFSLSILLSSVFIYNSLGHIDEKALENMSYVLRVSENMRMRSESEGEGEIAGCFPQFYWVLRDFSLDLKGMTETEYLEAALRPVSADEKDPKNQIRAKIRKLFSFRRCECFPRPINDEDRLAHIEDLNFEDLREKFRDKMRQFERGFFETLPVKLINGKPLTADIYLNLVREYVGAINSGKVPEVLTSLERVVECEARQATEGMLNNYRDAMNKITEPVDETALLRNHLEFKVRIETKFDEKLKNWMDVGRTRDYKARLLDTLEKDYKERSRANAQACEKVCAAEYGRLLEPLYELPEMRAPDLLADSYFKEQKNEFMKRTQAFLKSTRTPRNYLYLIEKFPKAFDYFDMLLARAKGVLHSEITRLGAVSRNQQAEVESLGRQLADQERLLGEKLKEIELLTYEKELLRREYEKNEKMKEFEKETDKMSKNEIKKTLESYKQQVLDLETQNQDLEAQAQKFRAELSKQKAEITQMVKKTSEPSETNAETALPNELLSSLSGLRERLSTMREFYESSLADEGFEEGIMRQLEDERTEKHVQIERAKEKYLAKVGELRKTFARGQAEQEKNIRLMNAHLDDLKSQNVELQREVAEAGDRRSGPDRRNLEESIRLKQNNINSLKSLNAEKDKRINDLEFRLASINAHLATLQSYKETFPFILSETLAWVQRKNNKLKHSIKTLSNEDEALIRKIFKDADLNPF